MSVIVNNREISDYTKEYTVGRLKKAMQKVMREFGDTEPFIDDLCNEVSILTDLVIFGYFSADVLDVLVEAVSESTPEDSGLLCAYKLVNEYGIGVDYDTSQKCVCGKQEKDGPKIRLSGDGVTFDLEHFLMWFQSRAKTK